MLWRHVRAGAEGVGESEIEWEGCACFEGRVEGWDGLQCGYDEFREGMGQVRVWSFGWGPCSSWMGRVWVKCTGWDFLWLCETDWMPA